MTEKLTPAQAKALADWRSTLLAEAERTVGLGLQICAYGPAKAPAHPKGFTDKSDWPAISKAALAKLAAGKADGFGVAIGPRSITGDAATGYEALIVVETEGRSSSAPGWTEAWRGAIADLGLEDLFRKLNAGWVETSPSGGTHWIARVRLVDPAQLDGLIKAKVKRAAIWPEAAVKEAEPAESDTDAPESVAGTLAEVLIDARYVITAPSGRSVHPSGRSWRRVKGGPDRIPVLTWSELISLLELIALLDRSPARTNGDHVYDERDRAGLYAVAKGRTTADTVTLLEGAGWVKTGTDGTATVLERDGHESVKVGGGFMRPSDVWTFSTSFSPGGLGWGVGHYRYGELRAALEFGGDVGRMVDELAAAGEIELRPRLFAAKARREVDVTPGGDTIEMASRIMGAIADATHPQADQPFMMAHVTAGGELVRYVSTNREGRLHVWQPGRDFAQVVALLACQPVTGGYEDGENPALTHSIPRELLSIVEGQLPDHLRTVTTVTSGPALMLDGTVLVQPGYHRAHRTLVAIPDSEAASWARCLVPTSPTQVDAQAAYDWINGEVLADFPFKTEGDRARAIAYFITCAVRHLTGVTPGWIFDAPDRGSGKSKLAALGRLIGTGSVASQSLPLPGGTAETVKEAVTAVLSGGRHLHIDDLPRDCAYRDAAVTEWLTQDGASRHRVLGGNTYITMTGLIITICGNNVSIGGDLQRRMIPIQLEWTGEGVPQDRTGFAKPDLEGWVRAHRPEVLARLFTLVAYGLRSPIPEEELPVGFGSFEQWRRVVLGALHHVGTTVDGRTARASELVVDGRREWTAEQDEEGQDWTEFMEAWRTTFGDKKVPPAELIDKVIKMQPSPALPRELVQVVGQSVAGQRVAWGRALAKRNGTRVRAGDRILRIVKHADAKRGNTYVCEEIADTSAKATVLHLARPAASESAAGVTTAAKPARKPRSSKPAAVSPPAPVTPWASEDVIEVGVG